MALKKKSYVIADATVNITKNNGTTLRVGAFIIQNSHAESENMAITGKRQP